MPHRFFRHFLLFDENLPPKEKFPRLNNRNNIKHLTADYKLSGLSDVEVYKLAIKEERILITYNDKHFYNFAKKSKKAGIIGLSANLNPEQIDKKLTGFLLKTSPKNLLGNFFYISGE